MQWLLVVQVQVLQCILYVSHAAGCFSLTRERSEGLRGGTCAVPVNE